jgi:hypothetical protein
LNGALDRFVEGYLRKSAGGGELHAQPSQDDV